MVQTSSFHLADGFSCFSGGVVMILDIKVLIMNPKSIFVQDWSTLPPAKCIEIFAYYRAFVGIQGVKVWSIYTEQMMLALRRLNVGKDSHLFGTICFCAATIK